MGLSTNGSMGLGGHGDGFEQQNDGQVRRQPGEGPKVNGGRNIDKPKYESFMGVRDSDVLDKQDPFRTGDGIHEESGEDTEYREHGKSLKRAGLDKKSSRKVAAAIAADHRREDPDYYKNEGFKITLKEFFDIAE